MKFTPYFNPPLNVNHNVKCNFEQEYTETQVLFLPMIFSDDLLFYIEKIDILLSVITLPIGLSTNKQILFIPLIRVFSKTSSIDIPFYIEQYISKLITEGSVRIIIGDFTYLFYHDFCFLILIVSGH